MMTATTAWPTIAALQRACDPPQWLLDWSSKASADLAQPAKASSEPLHASPRSFNLSSEALGIQDALQSTAHLVHAIETATDPPPVDVMASSQRRNVPRSYTPPHANAPLPPPALDVWVAQGPTVL